MTASGGRTQVNIRLDPDEADVLAAVAFLRDLSGAEVLRPVVQEFLREQSRESAVEAALEVRAQHRRSESSR